MGGFLINKYIIIIVNILFIIAVAAIWSLYSSNVQLKERVGVLTQNNKAYQEELYGMKDSIIIERYIYKLTKEELKTLANQGDSVSMLLEKTRKELNIANNKIKEYMRMVANFKTDTVINITNIITEDCQFDLTIDYNPQTSFRIANVKSDDKYQLRHSADISASFSGIGYISTQWKEPKFLKRLIKFNWKKIHDEKYVLKSDNELIKIHDFRIVKIIE